MGAGETVKAETGAMAAMSAGVTIEAKMEGGLFKALKRSAMGGESFFVTSYSSASEGSWVDVAANLPGDIAVIEVTSAQGIAVTRGSWLANESSVTMDTKWGGKKEPLWWRRWLHRPYDWRRSDRRSVLWSH